MNDEKCSQCGLHPPYQNKRTGKIYALCATCAWEGLRELLDSVDDEESTDKDESGLRSALL